MRVRVVQGPQQRVDALRGHHAVHKCILDQGDGVGPSPYKDRFGFGQALEAGVRGGGVEHACQGRRGLVVLHGLVLVEVGFGDVFSYEEREAGVVFGLGQGVGRVRGVVVGGGGRH